MNPAGHVVLITGGASGIGFALAQQFSSAGNRVIIVGRSEHKLRSAACALPGVIACAADISIASDRNRLVSEFTDISVLVNNAGIQNLSHFPDSTPADIEYELNVNFLAPVLLCHGFLPGLLEQESAAIVNVTSVLAQVPKKSAPIYCATKAALHNFSKTLRWQLQETNVKVFDVLPSLVDTTMTAGRGRAKISPERLAGEFWKNFLRDRFEMRIGLTRFIILLHRLAPGFVERLVKSAP